MPGSRRFLVVAVLAVVLAAGCVAAPIGGQPGGPASTPEGAAATEPPSDHTRLYERTIPSVVMLRVSAADGDVTGSGFVYDRRGHLVTNEHVVGSADTVEVRFHGGEWRTGTVVGTDAYSDLAVVRGKSNYDCILPDEETTVNRYEIHSSFPREEWQPGLDRLDCNAPEYVVLSSYHYFRFFKDPSVYPEVTDRMQALFAEEEYEIVRTFGPPIDTELSAERKFKDSAGLSSFPEDGNPTIVVLKRIDDEPTC
jgi:hypothetical protein